MDDDSGRPHKKVKLASPKPTQLLQNESHTNKPKEDELTLLPFSKVARNLLTEALKLPAEQQARSKELINHPPTVVFVDFEIEQSFGTRINYESYSFLKHIHDSFVRYVVPVRRDPSFQNEWKKMLQVSEPALSVQYHLYRQYESCCLSEAQLVAEGYPTQNIDLANSQSPDQKTQSSFCRRILCLDCQMVQTTVGSELAKITIVDYYSIVLYDHYVKPSHPIRDYRTATSGITKQLLESATKTLQDTHKDLASIICPDTILVGHSLQNDLRALKLSHRKIVDTAVLFKRNDKKLKLKQLAYEYLNKAVIQKNTHDSLEDCRYTLALAKLHIEILRSLWGLSSMRVISHPTLLTQVLTNNPQRYTENVGSKWHYNRVESCSQAFQTVDLKHGLVLIGVENEGSWHEYYSEVNDGLRKLYGQAVTGTKFIVAASVNRKNVCFVGERPTLKQHSYCLSYSK